VSPQSVAVPFDVDDLAVVEKPVEDSGSDHRISEEFLPVTEAFVGGDNGRTSFVAMGDELEEEVCLLGCDREVANFIDHH